jgi:two-component system CheB/CheR fusion protein
MSQERHRRPPSREGAATVSDREGQGGRPVIFVGIGAPAGALPSLKRLFAGIPAGRAAAFVVVRHPDPEADGPTVQWLRDRTALSVVEAEDGMPVLAGRIHVVPPGKSFNVTRAMLSVQETDQCSVLPMPIDHFLCSLAADQRYRACGILLAGAGSDGTMGLSEIKAAGGRTIVEDRTGTDPADIARRAIDAGMADTVLPADAMADAIVALEERMTAETRRNLPDGHDLDSGLLSVLDILRVKAGHDFRCYKPSTLVRRIRRRMTFSNAETFVDYARFLNEHPDEIGLLHKDLLIGVTEFFRQPQAWEMLEEKVIAHLVESARPGSQIRVWVPGCSTGKEAYSLSMLLCEQVEKAGKKAEIQIFATDSDAAALATARSGSYSEEEIGDNISPERLKRFFSRKEDRFQVIKEIRENIVFAPQNITADPPFSRLDLISCRNLLIYLEQEVQKKITALFHFALREGGFLFLGNAETVGDREDLFSPVSKKWRIYRRMGVGRRVGIEIPVHPAVTALPSAEKSVSVPPSARMSLASVAQQTLLERYAPACVMIDRKLLVLYVHGAVENYLTFPPGELTTRVVDMAREGLRARLRGAIAQCLEVNRPVTVTARVRRGKKSVPVRAAVTPLRYPREADGLLLIAFEDYRLPAGKSSRQSPGESDIRQLEDELKVTREELQSTIEQMESANDQLKAFNEEVTAANEELQSSNEELETSKEELQSLNEELNTVNARLQEKVEELEEANNDVVNLLSSTNIATVFLDKELKVKRYTAASTSLLSLIASDTGRPVADVLRRFTDETLLTDAARVLADLTAIAKEVPAADGRWYIRRITPYRTQDDRIEGVVLTFVDITGRKQAEQERERHMVRLGTLLKVSSEVLKARDIGGLLQSVVDAARELTGARLGTSGHGYVGGSFRVGAASRDRELTPCPPGEAFCVAQGGVYLELIHQRESIRLTDGQMRSHPGWWGLPEGHASLRGLLGARMVGRDGQANGLIMVSDKSDGQDFTAEDESLLRQLATIASLALQHIEARQEAEQAAEQVRRLALFPEENPNPVMRVSVEGILEYANPAALNVAEWAIEVGRPLSVPIMGLTSRAVAESREMQGEVAAGNRVYWLLVAPIPVEGYVNIYGRDITQRKQAEEALRVSEQRVRRTLESILSPEGDIGSLKLEEIIDVRAIQALMEDFYALARIPMSILDLEGRLLVGVGWQDICTRFHRAHPDACRHCMESDTILSAGIPPGEVRLYKCKNHMWDIATPVMVGGQHVGNLFSGQFFFDDETLDYDLFRSQARRYGFHEEEYIAALERVPRLSRRSMDTAMAFFVKLADMLSKLSYGNIKLARSLAERDALMDSLRKSEEDLNRAQAVAHTGSWRLDMVRNELVWSDEAFRIFGVPKGTPLTYETFLSAIHPEDRETVDRKWTAAIRGEPYDIEHRIVVGDQVKWVRERAELERDGQGALMGGFGTVQDITGRKAMEEKLRKSHDELELRVKDRTAELKKMYEEQKIYTTLLEQSNRDLEDFAHVASHDLQEPLRKIQAFGDRLAALQPHSDNDKARDYLERMQKAAARMQALVLDLLRYARVTSKPEPLIRLNLRAPVEDAAADLGVLLEETQGTIEIGDLPDIEGDQVQMRQLFQNLIANGLKYRSEHRPVIRIHYDPLDSGPCWEIHVEDNGIGFDECYLGNIFKPFQRLHRKDSPYPGTGMGLAICRRIVERHGGSITAKSRPAKGSTFIVRLPKNTFRREKRH